MQKPSCCHKLYFSRIPCFLYCVLLRDDHLFHSPLNYTAG
jgi:hypothetical protein